MAKSREKNERMKEAMEQAEKLKKEAAGDINTMEEMNEVKKRVKETEEKIKAMENAKK